VSTGAFPGPLRHILAQLDELRSGHILDMDEVGLLLVELAADEEYLGPLIAEMPSESAGGKWLVKPERGPRLVLFHRPEGVMAYTHSHHCWVAVAPVRGVETHQQWDAVRHEGNRAELCLADESAMHRGDVATLTPPGDIHNHGHVRGSGPSPYSLILLGDDMYLFEREEYDPGQGTWRTLAPGDPGRSHADLSAVPVRRATPPADRVPGVAGQAGPQLDRACSCVCRPVFLIVVKSVGVRPGSGPSSHRSDAERTLATAVVTGTLIREEGGGDDVARRRAKRPGKQGLNTGC